ncbi:hypothetical protein ASF62_02610 [Leifsonia sp. Leaf325]|nr:hypothetical protein ASF62_02610 [Leifsonia sp. Leaf325]
MVVVAMPTAISRERDFMESPATRIQIDRSCVSLRPRGLGDKRGAHILPEMFTDPKRADNMRREAI